MSIDSTPYRLQGSWSTPELRLEIGYRQALVAAGRVEAVLTQAPLRQVDQ